MAFRPFQGSTIALFLLLFALEAAFPQPPGEGDDPFALYEEGSYRRAGSAFLDKALEEDDPAARSLFLYNAGRSFQEEFHSRQDREALDRAIRAYYRVLDVDPGNVKAAHNLELARLQQKQAGREEQQESPPPSELSRQQDQLSRRDDQDSPGHRQEQRELQEETRAQRAEETDREARDLLDKALEKQEEALSRMEQNRPEEAKEAQQEAAELLRRWDQSSPREADVPPVQAERSPEPAAVDDTIQKILQAEQLRQEQDQQEKQENTFVEMNW